MKSKITTPLLYLTFFSLFSFYVFAIDCPVCGQDTFNGENCTNSLCGLNQPPLLSVLDKGGGGFIFPAMQTPGAGSIPHPPLVLQASVGLASALASNPVPASPLRDDNHAPLWLLAKSREAMRDTEGDLKWVPRLDPLLKEADRDRNNFEKIEPEQTADNIAAVLLSHLQTASHAFIIVYSTSNGQGETIQQILVVAVSQAGNIYVLTNVPEFWNNTTLVSPEEIIDMLGVDTFCADEEHIILYSYVHSLGFNRMPSIPEGDEATDE